MDYDLLVDVGKELEPRLRDRLLSLSYRASRSRRVGLVLRGISREAVDRQLDPVVEREGSGVRGVRYLEATEAEEMLRGDGGRRAVVVTPDPSWIPACNGDAPRVRSPERAARMLEDEEAHAAGPA